MRMADFSENLESQPVIGGRQWIVKMPEHGYTRYITTSDCDKAKAKYEKDARIMIID